MPIYEYQCQACGELTEALQKISDPLLRDCPHCGQAALKKKVSAAAFRLKGGGWYETDFKSAGRRNVAGEAAAGGDGKDGGGDNGAKGEKKSSSDTGNGDAKGSAASKPGGEAAG